MKASGVFYFIIFIAGAHPCAAATSWPPPAPWIFNHQAGSRYGRIELQPADDVLYQVVVNHRIILNAEKLGGRYFSFEAASPRHNEDLFLIRMDASGGCKTQMFVVSLPKSEKPQASPPFGDCSFFQRADMGPDGWRIHTRAGATFLYAAGHVLRLP